MAGGNKITQEKLKGDILSVPVDGGSVIYRGSMVMVTGGFAFPASDVAASRFVGVSEEKVDNSAGANGALSIRVRRKKIIRVKSDGSLGIGELAYALTAQGAAVEEVVTDAATSVNDVLVGEVVAIDDVDSDYVWIDTSVRA